MSNQATTYIHRTDGTYEGQPVPNCLTQHLWAKADGFGVGASRCHVCGERMEPGDDCTAGHYDEWLTQRTADNPTRWINAHQIEQGDHITWEDEVWGVVGVKHGNHTAALHLAKVSDNRSRALVKMAASKPVVVHLYQVWFGQR